ncbi:hypothetical protein BCR42DRAFT_105000 [Absidia repens]|uniref:HSF-type DNA-binding domain-containing protein n=1 Tax=Absidia repens TaxID=90262 RepID=A0A1X2I6W6_9FUNG|nr:hypothetical protein BCR42DRAFT_105000 [Absidia repens]
MQFSKKASSVKRQRSTSRSPSPPSPRDFPPAWTESPEKKRSATSNAPASRTQRNIPAFLNKLYSMVNDVSTDDLIRWSKKGDSFIVEQHELFSKTVLPRFYKHNTFSSFVRQLNMYDFHKVPHLQQGVMTVDSEHELWEFNHPNFQKNRYELLHLVVRKRIRSNNDQQQQLSSQQSSPLPSPSLQHQPLQENQQLLLKQHLASSSESDLSAIPPRLNALGDTSMQLEYVRLGSLVKDISTIRHHQHVISSDLQHLHNDNEILWRETLLAREKHQRHQQVIERILLFLTTVFSNDGPSTDTLRSPRYMLPKHDGNVTDSQAA